MDTNKIRKARDFAHGEAFRILFVEEVDEFFLTPSNMFMTIVLRIAIALVVFLYNILWKSKAKFTGNATPLGETKYFKETFGRGRYSGPITLLSLPISLPHSFHLHLESDIDHYAKQLGLATEFQTGDQQFDQKWYIASDNPHFTSVLKSDHQLREKIRELCSSELFSVGARGQVLTFKFAGDNLTVTETIKDAVLYFYRKLHAIPVQGDAGFKKIAIVEAIIWSSVVYAVASLVDADWFDELYFQQNSLVSESVFLSLIGALIYLGGLFLLMRKSSWSPLIFWQSGILLLFAVPVVSFQLTSEYNLLMDNTPTQKFSFQVASKEIRYSGRSQLKADHYIKIVIPEDFPAKSLQIPKLIHVKEDLFERTPDRGASLDLEIGAGRLGYAYFKNKTVRTGAH